MNRQAGRDIQSYHQDIVTKRVWIIPQICTIHRDGQREREKLGRERHAEREQESYTGKRQR